MNYSLLFLGLYFFGTALLVSLCLIPLCHRLSFRFKVLDHPIGNKHHRRPMPLLGGAGMLTSCLLIIVVHLLLLPILREWISFRNLLPESILFLLDIQPAGMYQLAVILIGGVSIFLVGLLDDSTYFDIRWRLASEFIIAALVTSFGIRPELNGVPSIFSWPITIVWIVGITNAFNLLDGMDGMVATITLIAASLMAAFCFMTSQIMTGFLLVILCGAVAGFLKSNWHPASIYMGSCGSLFLGYMMATIPLVVAFMQEESSLAAIAMPLLILSVPAYDTLSVICIRLWNRRSPFSPDHNHIFHRLSRLGLSVKKVVLLINLLAFAVGLSAMLLFEARQWEVGLICIQFFALYGVFIMIELVTTRQHDQEQIVRFKGFCFFAQEPEKAIPGTIRMLTANHAELEINDRNLALFALAMAEGDKPTLLINESLPELDLPSISCTIQSVWRVPPRRAFISLNFVFRDEWEMRSCKNYIACLLYPGRHTGNEEKSRRDSSRLFSH